MIYSFQEGVRVIIVVFDHDGYDDVLQYLYFLVFILGVGGLVGYSILLAILFPSFSFLLLSMPIFVLRPTPHPFYRSSETLIIKYLP